MRKRTVVCFALGGVVFNVGLFFLNWILAPLIKGGPFEKVLQKVCCPIGVEFPRHVFDYFVSMGLFHAENPIAFLALIIMYLSAIGAVYGSVAAGTYALYKKYREMKGCGESGKSARL